MSGGVKGRHKGLKGHIWGCVRGARGIRGAGGVRKPGMVGGRRGEGPVSSTIKP